MQDLIWLRTDDEEEAVNALEKFYQFILEANSDIYQWKWAIIALHNSIQAFMVKALKGSASFNVLRENDKQDWIIALNTQQPLSPKKLAKMKLDYFLNLYKRIQSQEMYKYSQSKQFTGNDEIQNSMEVLNSLRNNFIHFTPSVWSLRINDLPQHCTNIISIIEFLINESGNIYFYDNEREEKAKNSIANIKLELDKLETKYND
jgi:hypothetical protein